MNDQFFIFIIIISIIYLAYKIYNDSDMFHLTCIISEHNNKKYCIRDREKLNQASNLLAKTADKLTIFVSKMNVELPDHPITLQLNKNFNPDKIKETLPTSEYTAYSENKGEQLALCLNKSKNNNDDLIDENTLFFVALHELTHVGTATVGHDEIFWKNFKFILQQAVKFDLYHPEDYKKNKTSYCGMKLTDNPYFDL